MLVAVRSRETRLPRALVFSSSSLALLSATNAASALQAGEGGSRTRDNNFAEEHTRTRDNNFAEEHTRTRDKEYYLICIRQCQG